MKLLGAILAGGRSSRFGSDKALALVEGRRLIDHVAVALQRDCADVVVCGRNDPAYRCVTDQPKTGLGPLGGLCAALAFGEAAGFDAVLSAPCDVPDLPDGLAAALSAGVGSAYVRELPVVGLWRCALAGRLRELLETGDDRSLRAWARAAQATPVALCDAVSNINTPGDLVAFVGS